MTFFWVGLYLVALLAIGFASHRFFRGTGEDFFLASRSLGPLVLLMSLVGTHMTAFSILGASGEAYHRGIGIFALMASSSAVVIPAVFLFVGVPLWAAGKRHGYLTQVAYFRDRWGSEALARTLFVVLAVLLVPYLLIGIKGAGLTLFEMSAGRLPTWAGSGLMCAVVLAYVLGGGMRGTAWVNVFQTVIFLALGGATFAVIVSRGGGLGTWMARLGSERPELLTWGGEIRPLELASYLLIPLSAAMFPHLFTHWLTARRAETFRLSIVAYPLCVALVWLPSVLLGVMGRLDVPNLAGPASSGIVVQMIGRYAPGAVGSVLAAGVFAAVMASLDSQALAMGNMFTQDILARMRAGRAPVSERQQVAAGRLFIVAIVLVALLLSELVDRSIFKLGVWCFTGFCGLFPLAVAALYWRRSTAAGALACVVATAGSWAYFLARGWSDPAYSVGGTGLLAVAPVMLLSTAALVLVSFLTAPPEPERLAKFFGRMAP